MEKTCYIKMSKVYLETPHPSQDTLRLTLLPGLNAMGLYTNWNHLHPNNFQCEQKAESDGRCVRKFVIFCVLATPISVIFCVEKTRLIKEAKNMMQYCSICFTFW